MNNYFCELNLTAIFSNDEAIDKIYKFKRASERPYAGILTDFNELLNPELVYAFKQLQVEPIVLIAFGHRANAEIKINPFVHLDLQRIENTWVKVPFAINWEVYDTALELKWYDTTNMKECYPPNYNTDDPRYVYGNGINYVERYDFSRPNVPNPSWDFVPAYSHKFKHQCATMINTSIPHSVDYSGLESRLNISLRFNPNAIPTWESAIERFKSVR